MSKAGARLTYNTRLITLDVVTTRSAIGPHGEETYEYLANIRGEAMLMM